MSAFVRPGVFWPERQCCVAKVSADDVSARKKVFDGWHPADRKVLESHGTVEKTTFLPEKWSSCPDLREPQEQVFCSDSCFSGFRGWWSASLSGPADIVLQRGPDVSSGTPGDTVQAGFQACGGNLSDGPADHHGQPVESEDEGLLPLQVGVGAPDKQQRPAHIQTPGIFGFLLPL